MLVKSAQLKQWSGAAVIGLLAGLGVWALASYYDDPPRTPALERRYSGMSQSGNEGGGDAPIPAGNLAFRYAIAVQEGHCGEILRMTEWMNERLDRVQSESGGAAVEAERRRLCERAQRRNVERNQLSPEGAEDQYVFSPGARLTPVAVDEGEEGLSRPVRDRTWILVEYPSPHRALRGPGGEPIRSLLAGVNVSTDGYVLKAGVIGNLTIDRASISYDWNT